MWWRVETDDAGHPATGPFFGMSLAYACSPLLHLTPLWHGWTYRPVAGISEARTKPSPNPLEVLRKPEANELLFWRIGITLQINSIIRLTSRDSSVGFAERLHLSWIKREIVKPGLIL